ncbi:MAG: type II secretory pathway, component PulD [Puniceicoccaceae bacterium]|nr:MAG: type II secretory pathway, component PulD [Puniceicoccaceae bacterium]
MCACAWWPLSLTADPFVRPIRTLLLILFSAGLLASVPVASAQAPAPEAPGLVPLQGADDIVERIVLRDESLAQVLALLERLTGRSVLRPQALPTPTFTFNSLEPFTRQEAIIALESLLSINGIGVAPMGDKFLKVVPIAGIRTEAPELVIGSLLGEPPSGKVVSKLFQLQHLDSATFQAQIQPFLSPNFGTIIPFQGTNAVIVMDTISNLQRLEYVVSQVDRPSRLNIETRFYTIRFASASELANQLRTLIESTRTAFAPQGTQQQPQRTQEARTMTPQERLAEAQRRLEQAGQQPAPAPSPGADTVPLGVIVGTSTFITADERTNQLIVITDPVNFSFFDDIIEQLDIQADPTTRIEVIPLQHADAGEVASLLSQFIAGRTQPGARPGTGPQQPGGRATPLRGTFGPAETPPAPDRNQTEAVRQEVESVLEERDSQFSGFMTIVADERSNALIVSGTRNDLALISDIIKHIDILLAQVRIEVIIAEVTLSNRHQRGMDSFGISYDNVTGAVSVNNANLLGIGFSSDFILKGGSVSDLSIEAVFNTARTNSDINLLSVPTIVTTHNREATIIVGEARPIVTSTEGAFTGDRQRSTFQFQDIGIELRVKPLIGPNDIIQLEVDQKIDDVTGTITIDQNEQPIIGRRQATSFISVMSNQMVVLGGLQADRIEQARSRTAILGEIPLIGELFTRRTTEKRRTELIVFLRPRVIRGTDATHADAMESVERMDNPKVDNFLFPTDVEEEPSLPTRRFHK